MSVIGKVYGRVLINWVRKATEAAIGEEQYGFRKRRGCVDQIFVIKQLCKKLLAKGREVYFAFMDMEKAYNKGRQEGFMASGGFIWGEREAVDGVAELVL